MRIITSNYEDFRALIKGLFGETYVTFFGHKTSQPPKNVVVATDKNAMVIFMSPYSLPESFSQEFVRAIPLSDISEVEWPR